jgi:23S rRNA pseudouridine955/2504/2580 synthase
MHQLRVHCQSLNCPVLGDGKYGGVSAFPVGRVPLHLHSRSLCFEHPKTKKHLEFLAPPPSYMQKSLEAMFKKEQKA